MHWILPVLSLLILAAIAAWGLWFLGLFLWIPVKAVTLNRKLRRGLCPTCGQPFVKHWSTDPDQTYSSKMVSSQCANGHTYTSGNRRAADWAGF